MLRPALIALLLATPLASFAQAPTRQPLTEAQVPKAVLTALDATLGGPADSWEKVTLKNKQARVVATLTRLNPSSGVMVTQRVRYTEDGRQTSMTEYQAKAPKTFEEVEPYLGTGGVNPALTEKVKGLFKTGRIVSFERFSFAPGKQDTQVVVHRVRLANAKGEVATVAVDDEGRDVDLWKYPVRKLEGEDLD
ncbi:MAG: hypothetical protein MUC96_11485 [Myxococcaceae bacterium]|jgi:hypothetical protein|nr:hypothetical protein [Myxococcaceae bacterium]